MPDQTAVIAGVGPGVGTALARKFHQEGCRVGLLARSEDYLQQVTEGLADPERILGLPTDLTDPEQISRAFAAIDARFGKVDILVNHASYADWTGLLDGGVETFRKSWEVTVLGAYHCCRQVAPGMVEAGNGTILFTGATSSVRGRGYALGFSSAKFALRGMAQSLAVELWPQGVHVAHLIIDGMIDTPEVRRKMSPGPEEPLLEPDDIAESYWMVTRQPRTAWSWELDLRPYNEAFFV